MQDNALRDAPVIRHEQSLMQERTPPIVRTPQFQRRDNMSPSARTDDNASLNDDLLSVNSSTNRTERSRFPSGRPSMDSMSFRQSFESSSVWGRQGKLYALGSEAHSGSMDFSPLGNNSIYEIVMNTRRKNWLRRPTTEDIPPVILSKNELENDWKNKIGDYVNTIQQDYAIFERMNDLKHANGLGPLNLTHLDSYELSHSPVELEEVDNFLMKEKVGTLMSIPEFYFEEDFKLDDPRTFRKVLDDIDLHLDSVDEDSTFQRSEAYQELNERLNAYLDTIETLLVTEISKSSHKFFDALEDVDKIEEKALQTVNKLDQVSKYMQEYDQKYILFRIQVLRKMIKRKNLEKLEQGLLQVKKVVQLTNEMRDLYNNGNLNDALDMIDFIDHLIKGDDTNDKKVQEITREWPYKLLDLRSVPALASTREFLTNVAIEIGGTYSKQMCDILIEDIRMHCDSVSLNETLERLQSGKTDKRKDKESDFTFIEKIEELISKLIKCEELASAFKLYEDQFIVELKNIIKEYLPKEPENEETADRSMELRSAATGSKLSRLIKAQTPVEFQEMLVNIFTRESDALRRLGKHQKVLLDIALKLISTQSSDNAENSHNMIMQLDIRSGINEGIRTIQLRMGKIISVRRDITAKLRFDHFLRFYSICVSFIRECEYITGEVLTAYLVDVLTMQIKNYATSLKAVSLGTMKVTIEQEMWVPYIVASELQHEVNDIVSCIDLDPLDWTSLMDLTKPLQLSETDGSTKEERTQKGHKKSVVVSDKTFVASNALLVTIQIIRSILVLSTNLPPHFLPTFEKMCLDLLRYFNSRAMASVSSPADGNPTSKGGKNLSIMGESLDCLAEFASLIQGFYQRMGNNYKDFTPFPSTTYSQLLHQFQTSSDKLYQAHAPPPPV